MMGFGRFGSGSVLRGLFVCVALASATGCSAADDVGVADEAIVGAEESGASVDAITASYPAGSRLETTANLNLRTGASTSTSIILVMARGSDVDLVESAPRNGFYRVRYGSTTGWAYGGYLRVLSTPGTGGGTGGTGGTGGSSDGVAGAITRAQSGVGFSYWWGGARWLPSGPTSSNRGVCSGSCPSCTHSGNYGADCSGYVAKVWQVPGSNTDLTVNSHPYSTNEFFNTDGGGQWSRVDRGTARRGDAFVYRADGAGHIFLYESADPWGSMWAYEARGCSYGIVHNLRTATSAYRAIRRRGY